MLDLVGPALLRLVIYFAPVLFGLVGAAVIWLNVGVYDEAAGTITISLASFTAALSVMVGSGLTAITALLAGWKSKK